jgi:hypothetical protein
VAGYIEEEQTPGDIEQSVLGEQHPGCPPRMWLLGQRHGAHGGHGALRYPWSSRRVPRAPPTCSLGCVVGSSCQRREACCGSRGH